MTMMILGGASSRECACDAYSMRWLCVSTVHLFSPPRAVFGDGRARRGAFASR